jgi:hypothetical protein
VRFIAIAVADRENLEIRLQDPQDSLGNAVMILSLDPTPRTSAFERFPVPRNLDVSGGSRFEREHTWSAPVGASRVKKTFEIYRYDPHFGKSPAP